MKRIKIIGGVSHGRRWVVGDDRCSWPLYIKCKKLKKPIIRHDLSYSLEPIELNECIYRLTEFRNTSGNVLYFYLEEGTDWRKSKTIIKSLQNCETQ